MGLAKQYPGEPALLLAPRGFVAISVFVRVRLAWPQ